MKSLVTKNKTKRLSLMSKVLMLTLVLALTTVVTSAVYAASDSKPKKQQPSQVDLFDPFALRSYNPEGSILGIDMLTGPVGFRPRIRIPFRPSVRSVFKPSI